MTCYPLLIVLEDFLCNSSWLFLRQKGSNGCLVPVHIPLNPSVFTAIILVNSSVLIGIPPQLF